MLRSKLHAAVTAAMSDEALGTILRIGPGVDYQRHTEQDSASYAQADAVAAKLFVSVAAMPCLCPACAGKGVAPTIPFAIETGPTLNTKRSKKR